MPQSVTDFRSNANDQLAFAARVIGKGLRRTVFEAIYRGKKSTKTVGEIANQTGLTSKQVLTAGLALANTHLVEKTKVGKETAYQKDPVYSHYRNRVLALADDPAKLRRLPTKIRPASTVEAAIVRVEFPRSLFRIREVTVDDIDSFAAVRGTPADSKVTISERAFKDGIQRIIDEPGEFTDWGGERNDLFTSRVVLDGRRVSTAFAFKGPGLRAKRLTPAVLGKNGDQLQRLFQAPAELFVIQYHGQIDEQVLADMRTFAIAKSVTAAQGTEILYGVIDGADTSRLLAAYPDQFAQATNDPKRMEDSSGSR